MAAINRSPIFVNVVPSLIWIGMWVAQIIQHSFMNQKFICNNSQTTQNFYLHTVVKFDNFSKPLNFASMASHGKGNEKYGMTNRILMQIF